MKNTEPKRRRKGTGAMLVIDGSLVCRWRENGKPIERRVRDEREGQMLLIEVRDYRRAGVALREAIRKAGGDHEETPETITLAGAVDAWLAKLEREGKRTPVNLKHERYRAGSIRNHAIAKTPVDRLCRRDVARWTAALAREKQERTINRCLSLASRAWKWAYEFGYVPEDQFNPFRLVDRAREVTLDKDHLSHEEGRALVKAAVDDFQPVVIVALATGMRRGEILSLTWAEIDLKARVIVIRPENEKARGGRRVDMTPEVHEVFIGLKTAAHPAAPVFRTASGRPHTSHTVQDRMVRLRKAKPKIARHKLINLKFKDFRDTAICLMLEQGTPTATVARIVGHRTLTTTEKYLSQLRVGQRAAISRYGEVRFGT